MHHHPVARMIWCTFGAAIGFAVALSLAGPFETPFLLASLGGSTVFLFGLTRSPATQPRALLGGHLGGAYWHCLLPGLWRCLMGLCACPSAGLILHADYQDGSSSGWRKPDHYGSRPCGLVRNLAPGAYRGNLSRHYCCHLEPVISGPCPLPGCMA